MAATIFNPPMGGRSRHIPIAIKGGDSEWAYMSGHAPYTYKGFVAPFFFNHRNTVIQLTPQPDALAECERCDITVVGWNETEGAIELWARVLPAGSIEDPLMVDATIWDTDDDATVVLPMLYHRRGSIVDLLWTNSAPTANFEAQKITLDLTVYDYVIVSTFVSNNTEANRATIYDSGRIPKGKTSVLRPSAPAGSTNLYFRNVTVVEDTGVTFATGYTNTTTGTTVAIPMYIYGGRY